MPEAREKILIVDDDVRSLKLLDALLTPCGYEIVKAVDGAEALAEVRRQQPDLVLLDVMMPVVDGFQVCKQLKDDAKTYLIPVVLMTALGELEDRVKGIEAGADDFLTKPIHSEELLARIRTSLRMKRNVEHAMIAGGVEGNVCRREGDYWAIGYENEALRLKHARGVSYLAHLLRNPGEEIHVADLVQLGENDAGATVAGSGSRSEPGRTIALGLGNAGEMLDAQARAEYKRRLDEISGELERATDWGDSERARLLREEKDLVTEELSRALGLRGRARKSADTTERARKAVASRIRDTIARIERLHPVLAAHLNKSIRMGVFCCYAPGRSVPWNF